MDSSTFLLSFGLDSEQFESLFTAAKGRQRGELNKKETPKFPWAHRLAGGKTFF